MLELVRSAASVFTLPTASARRAKSSNPSSACAMTFSVPNSVRSSTGRTTVSTVMRSILGAIT